MKIRDMVRVTKGTLLSGDPDRDIDLATVSTDSRTIRKGEFFLALSGHNFCGSDFAADALAKGATGVIVERCDFKVSDPATTVIQVKDATRALQAIAAFHRKRFNIPVICVTGSNGKTTVKDMLWATLSTKFSVLRNEGTKNNHIGVPQTLLKLAAGHDMCVLELGTNHRGEIKALADIAQPTVSVITNVGPSHLEFLKDLKGVCAEKKDILRPLGKTDLAVVNGDDSYLARIRKGPFRLCRYGLGKGNDLAAKIMSAEKGAIWFLVNGTDEFTLNLLGVHNVYNALAAIAVAYHFGVPHPVVKKALAQFRPTGMRLDLIRAGGIDIINDAYNSNPLSMRSALESVRDYPARARWVVSADMLELGSAAVDFHRMVGELIAGSNIEGLVTFGELSKHTLREARRRGMDPKGLWHCTSHDEIAGILKKVAQDGDVILVKGSRGMRMEKVVEKLKG